MTVVLRKIFSAEAMWQRAAISFVYFLFIYLFVFICFYSFFSYVLVSSCGSVLHFLFFSSFFLQRVFRVCLVSGKYVYHATTAGSLEGGQLKGDNQLKPREKYTFLCFVCDKQDDKAKP